MYKFIPAILTLFVLVASVIPDLVSAQEKTRPQTTEQPVLSNVNDKTLQWRPCVNTAIKGCEMSVIRGVLEKGPSEVFLRRQPGSSIPNVWHSAVERGLLLQGKLIGTDDQGKEFTVTPGSYWYYPAGAIHGGVRCSDEGPCLMYEMYDNTIDFNIVSVTGAEKKQ